MARMTTREAMEVLARHRGERIVIPTMTAAGLWPDLSDGPFDFPYLPSAMGHAPGLGMGLALAQPQRGAIVVNGDGGMLMNLGSLVTLASQPANVFLIVLDNGIYEVTGGQTVAGSNRTDFAMMAKAAGFSRIYTFETLAAWTAGAAEALSGNGPAFIWIPTEARYGQITPKPRQPMAVQIRRLREGLGLPAS